MITRSISWHLGCCWLPRPTVHPFLSAGVGPSDWCSRLTPRRARTRTGGIWSIDA
jgi:hypothetical protein